MASEQKGAPAALRRKQYHIGRGTFLPGMPLYGPWEKSLKRALTSALDWSAKSQILPRFLVLSFSKALHNSEKNI